MSIVVYQDVATPIIPAGDLAGPVRDALGDSLRSMRYISPDFAGLYQDATGTTPVTAVGQPVGLMLDRRFGLVRGVELVTDPSFDDPLAWLSTGTGTSVSGGFGRFVASGPASRIQQSRSGVILGATYEITFVISDISEGGIIPRIGNTVGPTYTTTGQHTLKLVADTAQANLILLSNGASTTATISELSVRELPGNHLSQSTTAARPTLRSGPLRIDYDGVDDYLRTVFPDLGSDVTIARSIPGVGAQILTGQTIAAGDWDDNVTSCATLVIDRALTGPETALVTAFLNQQAGV